MKDSVNEFLVSYDKWDVTTIGINLILIGSRTYCYSGYYDRS